MKMFRSLTVLAWIALALPGWAQVRETEHTLHHGPSDPKPKATLQDIAWLQGAREGPAFGGTSEEIWSEPLAHTMMGVYRSVENGAVKFYEINTIVEIDGSLEMRLKHFHTDLTGWEEKATVRNFPLIKISPGEIYFDGMTYKKTTDDMLTVYLAIGDGKAGAREVVFEYRRRPL